MGYPPCCILKWDKKMIVKAIHFTILSTTLLTILFLSPLTQTEEILIWFNNTEAEKLNKGNTYQTESQGIQEHPCGHVKVVNVSNIPPPDHKNFIEGTEKVYEFNASGKIIDRWSMPVNSYLLAALGKNIVVRYGDSSIAISREGTLSKPPLTNSAPQLISCPKDIKSFHKNSGDIRCFKLEDLTSKKVRYFVHNSICT